MKSLIRKTSLLLLLIFSASLYAQTSEADSVMRHLEFLGYKCASAKGKISVTHAERLSFDLVKFRGGLLFKSWFGKNGKTQKDSEKYTALINVLNSESGVCRYYADNEGDLIIEGWYPLPYSKDGFATFLETWEKDFSTSMQKHFTELSVFIQ